MDRGIFTRFAWRGREEEAGSGQKPSLDVDGGSVRRSSLEWLGKFPGGGVEREPENRTGVTLSALNPWRTEKGGVVRRWSPRHLAGKKSCWENWFDKPLPTPPCKNRARGFDKPLPFPLDEPTLRASSTQEMPVKGLPFGVCRSRPLVFPPCGPFLLGPVRLPSPTPLFFYSLLSQGLSFYPWNMALCSTFTSLTQNPVFFEFMTGY
jgi:hypothetical protein